MDGDTTITAFMVARDVLKLLVPFAFALGAVAYGMSVMGRWR